MPNLEHPIFHRQHEEDRERLRRTKSRKKPGKLVSVEDYYNSFHQYLSWEELTQEWPKYFEDPAAFFDRTYSKSFYRRERKRRKIIERANSLRERQERVISNSFSVRHDQKINAQPLKLTSVFYFHDKYEDREVGIQLGYILAILKPDEQKALAIVNNPKMGYESGTQNLADVLSKPIEVKRKSFYQTYLPRS